MIRTRFTANTLTLMFASLSTPTRCLAKSSFALKARKMLLVTTGVCFLYSTPAFDTFTRLATKPRTWMSTIEISDTAILACNTVRIATAGHFKRMVSCAIEIPHHYLLAHVLTAILRTFPRTLMTAHQLSFTLI